MKTLTLLLFLLISIFSFSQNFYLDKTDAEIRAHLGNPTNIKTIPLYGGLYALSWYDKTLRGQVTVNINNNKSDITVIQLSEASDATSWIEIFDEKFTKVGKYQWKGLIANLIVKLSIKYDEQTNTYVITVYHVDKLP